MKKIGILGVVVSMLFLLAACGGGSSSDSTSTTTSSDFAATTLSSLPKATSPMASSASASVSKDVLKEASTGMALASTDSDFFSANSSMGACEMFNLVKDGIASAAQADMILCFVSYINEAALFDGLTDVNGDAIDIYDGAYHIFNLNIDGDEEAPDRVKMKLVKNDEGAITSFEMFMCRESEGTLVQNEYASQTLDGASLTMNALGMHADQEGQGWHSVDVVGSLDADGLFLSKEITVANVGEWGGNPNWQEGVLVQEPGSFTFSGYRAGSYSDGDNSGSYQDAAYGEGEMLGDSSTTITDLAMGDGAVQFYSLGTYVDSVYGEGTYGPFDETVAWLGDNGQPVEPPSDSAFYAAASEGTLPDIVAEAITISFLSDEQWDCSDDVSVGIVELPSVSADLMNAACSEYIFSHDWVNCYDVIEQGQQ